MRNYTYKWGRFLVVRWFVASWLLHGVHVLDKTERTYYIISELVLQLIPIAILYACGVKVWWLYVLSIVIIHSITWLVDSHWLVGYREVDKHFQSKGIYAVIEYVDYVKKELEIFPTVKVIALYGSMSRRMFHNRSDLDLRVLQIGKSFILFLTIQKLRFVGIWRYKIPLDLKLVDSIEYLKEEMREDEKAVVVYKTLTTFYNEGGSFAELKNNPSRFLKINNCNIKKQV